MPNVDNYHGEKHKAMKKRIGLGVGPQFRLWCRQSFSELTLGKNKLGIVGKWIGKKVFSGRP